MQNDREEAVKLSRESGQPVSYICTPEKPDGTQQEFNQYGYRTHVQRSSGFVPAFVSGFKEI